MAQDDRVEHVGEDLRTESDRPKETGVGAGFFRANFDTAGQILALGDPENGAQDTILTASKEDSNGNETFRNAIRACNEACKHIESE